MEKIAGNDDFLCIVLRGDGKEALQVFFRIAFRDGEAICAEGGSFAEMEISGDQNAVWLVKE